MANKTVFITGASGNMGWASFQEIYKNRPDLNLAVLLRDSEKNREKFADYTNDPRVKIVWGVLPLIRRNRRRKSSRKRSTKKSTN